MTLENSSISDVLVEEETPTLIGRCCGQGDRYQIKELVEEFSKVEVYHAYDDKLGRAVSLQIFVSGEDELAQKQKGIYTSFQHPNVCPILDATKIDDRPVHVLCEVKGFRLSELVNGETALAAEEIFNLAPHLLDVLVSLHGFGYVHLGLDPASILLSNGWNTGFRYLITNFTNAGKIDEDGAWFKPEPGMFRDCFAHSAPEVLNGGTADVRSDLFSLGSLIYQSFCGKVAYEGNSPIEISRAHQKDKPEHLGYCRPEIPVKLADWVMSLIAVNPDERPKTALDALHTFTKITEPITAESGEGSRVA